MSKSSALQNSLVLAPLIGATQSWMTALGLWLMVLAVTSAYGFAMALLRPRLIPMAQLIASLLLAATLTSCAERVAQAWSLQWHQHAGIYAGLIALQCVVLDHTGFFQQAWRDRLGPAAPPDLRPADGRSAVGAEPVERRLCLVKPGRQRRQASLRL